MPSHEPTAAAAAPHLGSLHGFFGPNGVLSRAHAQYEFRRGQLQMAEEVEKALADKRHLVVEAGTGTGKTLAYLVPVIRSGKRVIISTGTKNLQEQLFQKDVPFLEQITGKLRVCYMKGRNNYLCRQKVYDLENQPILSGLNEVEHFRIIRDWEKTTETGDRAELAALPENSPVWGKLDARTDACTGQKCQQWERCFITEMRRKAAESDIIIVNHHLFFADLAIKRAAEGAPDAGILPDAGAVIFDEAHELEDVAGAYFGVSVSNLRFAELARDIEFQLRQKQLLSASISSAVVSLRDRSQFFFSLLPPGDGRFSFDTRREFLEENGDEYLGLANATGRLAHEMSGIPEKPEEVFNLIRRCEELRMALQFVMESQDKNTVFWIERRSFGDGGAGVRRKDRTGGHVFIPAPPIDVSQILRQTLFEMLETAVLTSATLAVSGGFEYISPRLGLQPSPTLGVPSTFDYETQAILYVPPDLPDPRTPQFTARAADRIRKLLE